LSLTLREEHAHGLKENRVLRKIFGPRRGKVTEGQRKLHNDLYSLPSVIRMINSRRMRWSGHAAQMREKRKRES
jgi:hypothetical protein